MPLATAPVSGPWWFRFDDEADAAWRLAAVPGCWEDQGGPKDRSGPAWYRTTLSIPQDWAGRRVWVRFAGVSYHCRVWVNGVVAGEHTGLWDAFRFDISGLVQPGEQAELLVQVEKPAGLRAGPDSPRLPGRFPLRETLVGFLPYVWGSIFGGIWQEVTLEATGEVWIAAASVRGAPDGNVILRVALSAPAAASIAIIGPGGAELATSSAPPAPGHTESSISLRIPDPRPWSPNNPFCYTARIVVANGDVWDLPFGLRALATDGSTLLLNGSPLYPRMALSWGWYPETLSSNPAPERVRSDFAKLKALGYNGVKLCLWFPPQYYFDLADELGMLLWVELPLWLPQPGAGFAQQVTAEYGRMVALARNHPSVMLYSLGCELNRSIGPELLEPLFRMVKGLVGDALVRDNSGSGEAYGGLLNEFAEYYDYHFYAELQFFQPLLDYFAPRWRPTQPWVFGEFCDLDTFRDLRMESDPPWWLSNDQAINPQGARWQFDVPFQKERLQAAGLLERGEMLRQISERQGLLHRKWTLEMVRLYREIGGYVITGEADTPISTAGMWDDTGRLKFDPAAFRAFNSDLVLLVGWDRRRAWVAGGDRAAPWDSTSYPGGALVRPHFVVSHYGAARGPAQLSWSVAFAGEAPFAQGTLAPSLPLAPGDLRELGVAEIPLPEVAVPHQMVLRASLVLGDERAANEWPLWVFPRAPWADMRGVWLHDPALRLDGLRTLAPGLLDGPQGARVALASSWTAELDAFVRAGGGAVLLVRGEEPGPLSSVEVPFWREAVRVVEDHAAWGDFPHAGWAGSLFFGCATDRALDIRGTAAKPILWRLDARTMATHAYIAELPLGAGRLIVSTLRFEGGHGAQPAGIARNTAASYLLRCLVRTMDG